MLIGYSVLYIDNDPSVNEILWSRKIVYGTWDKALKQANILAEHEKTNLDADADDDNKDDNFIVSLARADSKSRCETFGHELIYKIQNKVMGQIGEIYIVPIFDE